MPNKGLTKKDLKEKVDKIKEIHEDFLEEIEDIKEKEIDIIKNYVTKKEKKELEKIRKSIKKDILK